MIAAVIALVLAGLSAGAGAEVLHTNMRAKLRARPGESYRVVAKLRKGRKVRVLRRRGRWLRVKSGEHVGWLTRTTVRSVEPRKKPERRPTRVEYWRKSDKPEGERPVDKKRLVEARSAQRVFREPLGQARVAFKVAEGDILTVVGDAKSGEWLLVEDEHGHLGWIPAIVVAPVTDRSRAAQAAVKLGEKDSAPVARAWSPDRAFAPRAVAAIGYRSLGMDFTSESAGGPGGYVIAAPAAMAVVAASMPFTPDGSRLVATVDGEYRMTYATPGIRYRGEGGVNHDISFSMHEVNAAGQLGVRLSDNTVTVAARAGYHYGVFYVDELDNAGKLPRESLGGLRVGGRAHYAPRSSAYVLRAGFDMLVSGTRGQTPGLEDGTDSTASAWWASVGMDYPLTADIRLTAQYAYERAETEWTGASARQPDVTGATRVDHSHVAYLGMARGF